MDSFVHNRPWFLNREASGGGILLSGGIHDFAKLRVMLGEIESVHCLRARQRFQELETEDTVVMLLGFANGAVGTLVESFFMIDPVTTTGAEDHRLRIDGDLGSIELVGPGSLRVTTPDQTDLVTVPLQDTFRSEVREFLDCVGDQAGTAHQRSEAAEEPRAGRSRLHFNGFWPTGTIVICHDEAAKRTITITSVPVRRK